MQFVVVVEKTVTVVASVRATVAVLGRRLQPQHHGLVLAMLLEFLDINLQSRYLKLHLHKSTFKIR
jgi:hypothetical protein